MIIDKKHIQISNIKVDGYKMRVAVRSGKENSIPLVLFNGIGANWELFLPFINALDPDLEVVAFDVPGVGASPTPIKPYRFKSLSKRIYQLLDMLQYDKVFVLGISWGGALAQQFAHMYPSLCDRLILIATSSGFTMVPGKPSVLLKMATPYRYWNPSYMKSIAGEIYGGRFRKNNTLINKHTHKIRTSSGWGYFLQMFAGSGWTSAFWLHKLEQPTLILAGDDDPIIPLVNARFLASRIPDATLEVIEGGGHLFLLTQPERSIELIEGFLSQE